jgi:hypothetical protein
MKKRKRIAATGIVTTLFIMGSGTAFAQTPNPVFVSRNNSPIHRGIEMRESESEDSTESESYGISANDDIGLDVKLGNRRMITDILTAQGFNPSQIHSLIKPSSKTAVNIALDES